MAYKVGFKAPALDEFANLHTQVKWQDTDDEILKVYEWGQVSYLSFM